MSDLVRIDLLPTQLSFNVLSTGPCCRAAISKKAIFSRAAFEPTDDELAAAAKAVKAEKHELGPLVKDEDENMPDVMSLIKSSGKGKGKVKSNSKPKKPRKKRAKRAVVDSEEEEEEEEEDEDDDLSDFIVYSDEDEDEKDERRRLKKKLGKRRASSYYEEESSESEDTDDDEIVYGRKKPAAELAPIRAMSRLLPSTKMKVRFLVGVAASLMTNAHFST